MIMRFLFGDLNGVIVKVCRKRRRLCGGADYGFHGRIGVICLVWLKKFESRHQIFFRQYIQKIDKDGKRVVWKECQDKKGSIELVDPVTVSRKTNPSYRSFSYRNRLINHSKALIAGANCSFPPTRAIKDSNATSSSLFCAAVISVRSSVLLWRLNNVRSYSVNRVSSWHNS